MGISIHDVMKWEGYMRTCCHQICTDQYYVDEAIQQTYLYLLERKQREGLEFLEWKGQPNKHYLRLVATSQLLYILRTESRRNQRENKVGNERREELLHEARQTFNQEHDSYVGHNDLLRAIQEQEPYDREILKLVYFRSFSQKQISQETQIPYQTLLKDVKDAREKVKQHIKENCENKETEELEKD